MKQQIKEKIFKKAKNFKIFPRRRRNEEDRIIKWK